MTDIEIPTMEVLHEPLTDSEKLDEIRMSLLSLNNRLDMYERMLRTYSDNEVVVAKLQSIVQEFVASGGVASILPGMLGGF